MQLYEDISSITVDFITIIQGYDPNPLEQSLCGWAGGGDTGRGRGAQLGQGKGEKKRIYAAEAVVVVVHERVFAFFRAFQ